MKLCVEQLGVILFLVLIGVFIIGVVTQQPVLQIGSILVFLGDFLLLLSKWYEKREKKKERQKKLLINDFQNFTEKTTFPNIKYNWIKVEAINYKEAKLDYRNKVINILKEYGACEFLKKGKDISKDLQKDGIEAIKNFHKIVNELLESLPLEKSLEIGRTLSMPYYSEPRVHEAIFKEISGEHFRICVKPESSMINVIVDNKKTRISTWSLCHGDATLAKGAEETMNRLKERVESLMRNKKVRIYIETFKKAKEKLDTREPFSEFESKFARIIAELRWNH